MSDVISPALHLTAPKRHALPWAPSDYAAGPVPTLKEWHALWKLWDDVTLRMIPNDELLEKPIKLRNACIFYLGHIPTFFDIKLTHCTRQPNTEPKAYVNIFERGIDPDVDNPEQCHAHSEVPDNWPDLGEILAYQSRVRDRVEKLYADGSTEENRLIARCMWLGYEHEAMHLETLLYMLIQSERTKPPPDVPHPNFKLLAENAQKNAVPNKWFDIPAKQFTVNMEDPENEKGPLRFFGWDIEKPSRPVKVGAFQAQARPITNGEYAEYMMKKGVAQIPASWTTTQANGHASNGHGHNGDSVKSFCCDKAIRTVFGAIPLEYALSWPVSASYEELSGCAQYMGGRIPTFEESRSIYLHAEALHNSDAAAQANARMIPAVNNSLTNDGVTESPPSNNPVTDSLAGPNPHDMFVNLSGQNVGFQEWNPVSVVEKGDKLQGQAGMGGLWEWTSSALTKHEGFEPMRLYEAYSRKSSHFSRSRAAGLTLLKRTSLMASTTLCSAVPGPQSLALLVASPLSIGTSSTIPTSGLAPALCVIFEDHKHFRNWHLNLRDQ